MTTPISPPAPQTRTTHIVVRDAQQADIPAIAAIYAHHVLHGLATFEETPPTQEDLVARWRNVRALGLPYLVADLDGVVAGYCYATAYRPRPAYRNTIEDSVYVAEGMQRRGVGLALLGGLIERCEGGPWRQMIAVVANGTQSGSLALHRRLGFRQIGALEAVGFKLGQWVDTVLMQRTLGSGRDRLPDDVDTCSRQR